MQFEEEKKERKTGVGVGGGGGGERERRKLPEAGVRCGARTSISDRQSFGAVL